jgi:hydroxypyruvate reductase 2
MHYLHRHFYFKLTFTLQPNPTRQYSMANQNNNNNIIEQSSKSNNLPKVFLHGPPKYSTVLQPNPSHNFHILNPSSHPPLHEFIALNPHNASSIAAIVCTGGCPVKADVLQLLPSLRLVCTPSAGTNHIDLSECRRRGIQVASAGSIFSEDVADMAVALLIDVCRKISVADRFLRSQLQNQNAPWDFPLGSKVCNFIL